ncbi:MAG: AGE family epimerase/isomerase [Bacillota bacterium]
MELKLEIARHLSDTIIPFWSALRDFDHGGYIGYVGYDLKPDSAAPKGCIQNSRILWFFSAAYMLLKQPVLLECANQACQFMTYFSDRRDGGLYWMCTADGVPMDETKHTYNHAFAIYALAAYARASGREKALRHALSLFELIETRMVKNGLYEDAFTRSFRPLQNLKLSDNPKLLAKGVVAEKTMNTLLHVLEAYTLLYEVSGDLRVQARLRWLLDLFCKKVYNPEKNRLEVFFDSALRPLIDMQSYGHDIEASWLIDRAAEAVLAGEDLAQTEQMTARLCWGVLERAFQNDSLLNERVEGEDDPRRIWWAQCETMIGLANLWQKTGNPALMEKMQVLWQYIQTAFLDKRQGGERYAAVDSQGKPLKLPVAEPWKAPYHNGRMCMELMRRL